MPPNKRMYDPFVRKSRGFVSKKDAKGREGNIPSRGLRGFRDPNASGQQAPYTPFLRV